LIMPHATANANAKTNRSGSAHRRNKAVRLLIPQLRDRRFESYLWSHLRVGPRFTFGEKANRIAEWRRRKRNRESSWARRAGRTRGSSSIGIRRRCRRANGWRGTRSTSRWSR